MFSFYTIWTRFQISVFIVNRFGDWMLCVQRRSIDGFFLFVFSTVKINFVGTESSFKRILCPPIGFMKQLSSKCWLQIWEFLFTGVFSRRSFASHCARNFLFDSGSKCHDKPLHSTLELRFWHPNAMQYFTMDNDTNILFQTINFKLSSNYPLCFLVIIARPDSLVLA